MLRILCDEGHQVGSFYETFSEKRSAVNYRNLSAGEIDRQEAPSGNSLLQESALLLASEF
jgi:hypothetical protein